MNGLRMIAAATLVLGLHGPAQAATAVGGNDLTTRNQVDTYTNFTLIDRNRPIAIDGFLTGWEIYARADWGAFDPLQLVIFRQSGPATFDIVGTSELRTPAQVGVNTFTLASPIAVLPGDLVGLRYAGKASVPFELDAPSFNYYRGDFQGTMLFTANNAGLTSVLQSSSDRTYSIRVLGAPSSSVGGNDLTTRNQVDTYTNFTLIDRNRPIAIDGFLTGWEIYARADWGAFDPLQLVIFRQSGPATFDIVGTSELRTPAQVGVNTFTLASPIAVLPGDLVGLRYAGKASVPFELDAPSFNYYRGDFQGTMLFTANNAGLTSVLQSSSDRTYSIRVAGVAR